jgi:tRNA(Ile2) C34 agmatinyltransferase TiaS
MQYICPECGGDLKLAGGVFVCLKCGLTFKKYELKELIDSLKSSIIKENDEEKRRREYLRWWLSRKSDRK